jgi:hypothetical protein
MLLATTIVDCNFPHQYYSSIILHKTIQEQKVIFLRNHLHRMYLSYRPLASYRIIGTVKDIPRHNLRKKDQPFANF